MHTSSLRIWLAKVHLGQIMSYNHKQDETLCEKVVLAYPDMAACLAARYERHDCSLGIEE